MNNETLAFEFTKMFPEADTGDIKRVVGVYNGFVNEFNFISEETEKVQQLEEEIEVLNGKINAINYLIETSLNNFIFKDELLKILEEE